MYLRALRVAKRPEVRGEEPRYGTDGLTVQLICLMSVAVLAVVVVWKLIRNSRRGLPSACSVLHGNVEEI
jgi:hypothetical protein